jgi:hypothetical protein
MGMMESRGRLSLAPSIDLDKNKNAMVSENYNDHHHLKKF